MSGCYSCNKPNVEIIDETPKGKQFDFLRPNRTITYTVERIYDAPEIEINFDCWYKASVWFWHKSNKLRSNFLNLQRTPLPSPTFSISSSIDSGINTVF